MLALALFALAPLALADTVLFDFETGSQGWGSFGPVTTDSGPLLAGSVGKGRFHTGDFSLGGWGMVDVSPVVDLSAYTGMSVDARLRNVPGFPDFVGAKTVRFLLAIGYTEYTAALTLTDEYQTYAVDFADLVPPIPAAELSNPNLQIKLAMDNADNEGTAELDYDQVTGIVPEPVAFSLWGLGLTLVARRRR